ncbi:MAG: acetylxylan esterase, partial [Planctomycetota bacterium]
RGEFLAMANASPVYALYGLEGMEPDEMPPLESPLVRGHMSYHIRPGGHGLEPYDWEQYMNFADGLWGRKP